jgi:septal ring factor EnvC (AmiA/AmiB activator)
MAVVPPEAANEPETITALPNAVAKLRTPVKRLNAVASLTPREKKLRKKELEAAIKLARTPLDESEKHIAQNHKDIARAEKEFDQQVKALGRALNEKTKPMHNSIKHFEKQVKKQLAAFDKGRQKIQEQLDAMEATKSA